MKRAYNFNPGPAILPLPVLQEASQGILEIGGSGMSILEVSHRGGHYEAIHFEARDRLLKLLGLKAEEASVLFLGGGASVQFAMVPMNFLPAGKTADYVVGGEFGAKAASEAKKVGSVNVAASSEADKHARLPRGLHWTPQAAYAHVTSNNTIEGTQFQALPADTGSPLVLDATSEFLSKPVDFSRVGLVYAGAQKNLGPAGLTVCVLRKDFLATAREDIPAILSYKAHAKADSLFNTPPVFAVYMFNLVLKWLEAQGGLEGIRKVNERKAALVYQALDEFPDFYDPAVTEKADRSKMNVTFRLKGGDKEKDKEFLAKAEARNLVGLKGHRSVGGFRASIYNAFPEEGCQALAAFLRDYAQGRA